MQSKLFTAVEQNDTGLFMELVLSTHCDPRYVRNEQQETLLHVACRLNHSSVIDMVRTLVEIYQCSPLLLDKHSLTAYHYACQSGNLEVLSYLFRIGGYNYITDFQPPPPPKGLRSQMLITASQSGSIAMMRFTYMLCKHKHDHMKLNLYSDVLNILCKTVDCDISNRGKQHVFVDHPETTSLYEACCAGSLATMKFFLEELKIAYTPFSDFFLESKEQCERSVYTSLLEVAYRLNNLEIAQYLMKTKGFGPVQTISGYPQCRIKFSNLGYNYELDCSLGTCSPLHMALQSGNIQAVRGLISQDSHLVRHLLVGNHDTLLHSACVSGKKEMVELLVDNFKCDVNVCNDNGDTPLHISCEWGHFNICLFLLEQMGCYFNVANIQGHTPLTFAIRHNRLEIFKILLSKGADMLVTTKDSLETPLHLACYHDNSDFAAALLDDQNMCAYLNTADKYGDTPLFNACRVGNIKVVKCLIAKSDNIRTFVNKITKETPAHVVCRMKRLDILRALVCEGIDSSVKYDQLNYLEKSLLHVACDIDAEDIINYLIDNEVCKKNNMDHNGHTPLHIACMRGNTNIVKKLLMSKTCKITDEDKEGNTIFHYICSRDLVDPELVKLVCVNSGNSMIGKQNILANYNPLHYVCENDGIQVFHCLLEHLSLERINLAFLSPDNDGNTPLHLAFKQRRTITIKFILNCAELANSVSKALCIQNTEGRTPLHIACIAHEFSDKFAQLLLSSPYLSNECLGKAITLQTSKGRNVFHHIICDSGDLQVDYHEATISSSVVVVQTFLQTINSKLQEEDIVLSLCQKDESIQQYTPIQYLVSKASHKHGEKPFELLSEMSHLLASKLNSKSMKNFFSVTTSQGETLVHIAARSNAKHVIKLLIDSKLADLKQLNDDNNSALHIACELGYEESALYLCSVGCNPAQGNIDANTPIHLACKSRNSKLVKSILQSHEEFTNILNKKNSDGNRPLFYVRDRFVINYLLSIGAAPEDAYHSQFVEEILRARNEHPLKPALCAVVIGNSSVGKSTLIAALKSDADCEMTDSKSGMIEHIEGPTAGMVNTVVESKHIGRVKFFDFAGQPRFESSHSTLLQSLANISHSFDCSPLLFILVVKICSQTIVKQMQRWLAFIMDCPSRIQHHVLLLCSHADQLESDGSKEIHVLNTEMKLHLSGTDSVKFVTDPILLDCRRMGTSELKLIKDILKNRSSELAKCTELDSRCHLLFAKLLEWFQSSPVKVSELQKKLIEINQYDCQIPLPDSVTLLIELLENLHSGQHVLLFKYGKEISDYWVLTGPAQSRLFEEVNGVLFAPESFDKNLICKSNVGILPLSTIKQCFPKRSIDLIEEFLTYSEFCQKIKDTETLKLIQGSNVTSTNLTSPDEYLFFPGLVNSDRPDNIWNSQESSRYSYACGWCLQSTSKRGFLSRFMHVLFLRLTFTFAVAVSNQSSTAQTALKRRCNVWRNGIHWSTIEGVEILVEFLEEMSVVLVLIRCLKGQELEAVCTRSSVLKMIWETKLDISPQLNVDEYLIHSPDLSTEYPNVDDKSKISIIDVAQSVTQNSRCVVDSTNQPISLDDLLYFEPYCRISMKHTNALFSDERANEDIPSNTLLDISETLHPVCEHLIKVLEVPSSQVGFHRENWSTNQAILLHQIFESWKRREAPASFQKLRSKLNEFSIFFGRNPQVGMHALYSYGNFRLDLMNFILCLP